MHDFTTFFESATTHSPLPYQVELATAAEAPQLVSVPTGLGKTEAIACAWLWALGGRGWNEAPRRLVWCLPMRSLVEQTRDRVQAILERGAAGLGLELPAVHILMGGEDAGDWFLEPEAPKVLIGTQDMLLSRALNRGYGSSRFRWPQEFGLLHSDALWVYDELQLMGAGVATSAQLEAFRSQHPSLAPSRSIWMSATLRKDWLATVDFAAELDAATTLSITDKDRSHPVARARLEATKSVEPWTDTPLKNNNKGALNKDSQETLAGSAKTLLDRHKPGALTILIANTVERARKYHEAIQDLEPSAELLLLHSRFRPADRQRISQTLQEALPTAGRVLVATQVVEAGIDLDAALLVSELAPWASMVQRLGRLNRKGTMSEATFGWIDLDESLAPPYSAEPLAASREKLQHLASASPTDLPATEDSADWDLVLRRREFLELCDTEPDLTGADIDISRYIRVSDERDVLVAWHELGEDGPGDDELALRDELCRVPIGALREFLMAAGTEARAWVRDFIEGTWRRVGKNLDGIAPGRTLLLDAKSGGYAPDRGWLGAASKSPVPPVATRHIEPFDAAKGAADDPGSYTQAWATLDQHTDAVARALEEILSGLPSLPENAVAALRTAARWHDRGKAHPVFQATLLAGLDEAELAERSRQLWAKSGSRHRAHHARAGFRHELASGLAMLQAGLGDLPAYLAAAHHGKLRLGLHSLPGELDALQEGKTPPERMARGIYEGDILPESDLGGGVIAPEVSLTLAPMDLGLSTDGTPSWQDRMEELLDELGPFQLIFLEALLRAADARGSRAPITSSAPALQS